VILYSSVLTIENTTFPDESVPPLCVFSKIVDCIGEAVTVAPDREFPNLSWNDRVTACEELLTHPEMQIAPINTIPKQIPKIMLLRFIIFSL